MLIVSPKAIDKRCFQTLFCHQPGGELGQFFRYSGGGNWAGWEPFADPNQQIHPPMATLDWNHSSPVNQPSPKAPSGKAHHLGEEALGEIFPGGPEDLGRGAGLKDFPGSNQRDPVGDSAGEAHFVVA